jgi:hypothetical protein
MSTVRPISEKKRAANRRNARRSTGPKTEPGKHASRLNAVSHGLLAQGVVITAGDYQEDAQAFAQLLARLRKDFTPVGVAEDLDVQAIALCHWRKMRALRYEHGAIRTRTGDLRAREALRREDSFDSSLREILYRSKYLKYVRQEVLDGTVSAESHAWLVQTFPEEFPPPEETQGAESTTGGPVASKASGRQMVAKIDRQLRRLASEQEKISAIEALHLDSKIRAAALPAPAAVDKLIRYETANDRALDRAHRRLEGLQARRRQPRGTPTEP